MQDHPDSILLSLHPHATLVHTPNIATDQPRATDQHRHDGDEDRRDRDRRVLGLRLTLVLLLLSADNALLDTRQDSTQTLNVCLNATEVVLQAAHFGADCSDFTSRRGRA
jgi:hypothetical protein